MKKTTKIIIVIIAAALVAAFLIIGFSEDWFVKRGNVYTVEDYSSIQMGSEYSSVSDEAVQEYIDYYRSLDQKTTRLESGTVETGDIISIDFEGRYEGNDQAFSGGTARDYEVTVGSGSLLFDDQLKGKKVGDTFETSVMFPDDYNVEEMRGARTIFKIKINAKLKKEVPEFNDAWCREYSEKNFDTILNTTDEFTEYVRQYIFNYNLYDNLEKVMLEKIAVQHYDSDRKNALSDYYYRLLQTNAASAGLTEDTYAERYGYKTAKAYASGMAEDVMKKVMLFDKIFEDYGLTYTDEDFEGDLNKYMEVYGYSQSYTLDSFKEYAGEDWLYVFRNTTCRRDRAMDAIAGNVVFEEAQQTD